MNDIENGTAAHAVALAAYLEAEDYGRAWDGVEIAPSDAALCARALRAFAAREDKPA